MIDSVHMAMEVAQREYEEATAVERAMEAKLTLCDEVQDLLEECNVRGQPMGDRECGLVRGLLLLCGEKRVVADRVSRSSVQEAMDFIFDHVLPDVLQVRSRMRGLGNLRYEGEAEAEAG